MMAGDWTGGKLKLESWACVGDNQVRLMVVVGHCMVVAERVQGPAKQRS